MKNQKKILAKQLQLEPEYYEELLKKYGHNFLLPEPVKAVTSKFNRFMAQKTVTSAKAAVTVMAVSGFSGVKVMKNLVSRAKSETVLSNNALIKALFVSSASLSQLNIEVRSLLDKALKQFPDESNLTHASFASSKLIKKSVIKSGTLGGLTSAPGTIPGIGTVGTIALMFSSDFFYLIRTQFLLCYGIARAYKIEYEEEQLQAICISLMGFSDSVGKDKKTAKIFRQVIDQTVDTYITIGLNKAFKIVLDKISLKTSRRFLRVVPFIGIPFGMFANVESVSSFGEKAEVYFKNLYLDNGSGDKENKGNKNDTI